MSTRNAPYVLEDLSEEEAYLFAILTDISGLDQAEFLWQDMSTEDNKACVVCDCSKTQGHKFPHEWPMKEDDPDEPIEEKERWYLKYPAPSNCFRAWAYQWTWWRTMGAYQIDQSARSVGKSLSIKVRACAFPFVYPGQEMLITAPELNHLEPITQLIETQVMSTWLLHEMLQKGRSKITHRPFFMGFQNGARILGAIPQRDGKGVKGKHPIWLELDEAQDYPKAGWTELRETLKRGFEGAMWRAHGVTRGVRDEFWKATQDSSQWMVHRYPAMFRPNWTAEERQEKIIEYGSREDPDYRRNVLGEHGDATNPIFVLAQLMQNVDSDPMSDYNQTEYFNPGWGRTAKVGSSNVIKVENLQMFDQDITQLLDFPAGHLMYRGGGTRNEKRQKCTYWAGYDVGWTIDPSEMLIFVEYNPKDFPNAKGQPGPQPKGGGTVFKLLTRVSMIRMPHHQQVQAILHAIDFYKPRAFAIDKAGTGLPLFMEIQEYVEFFEKGEMDRIPEWMQAYDLKDSLTRIKGYNAGSNLIVDLDSRIEVDWDEDQFQKAGLKRNAKDFATDKLRELVDTNRMWLPWDETLLAEFQGGTWSPSKGGMNQYGKRVYSVGNDHCVAAGSLVTTARGDVPIEQVVAGDQVLTRVGLHRVTKAWRVAENAETVEVECSDGRALQVTTDHRVHTHRGWVTAGRLEPGDIVTSWHQDQRSLSSMGSLTGAIQTPHTGRIGCTSLLQVEDGRVAVGSMRRSGRKRTGRFRKAGSFITSTRTRSTTTSRISSASPSPSTTPITTRALLISPVRSSLSTLSGFVPGRLSGTRQTRGALGMPNTPGGLQPNGHSRKRSAKSVARAISPSGQASSAQDVARPEHFGVVVVKRVSPSSRADVYDLSVDGQHEFFADGVLVHNCLDASRYAMLGYAQYAIEELMAASNEMEPILDVFVPM